MYYFDSAYVAKCYWNDPDGDQIRDMVRTPVPLYSSALCIAEATCAIHRRYREALLPRKQTQDLTVLFKDHIERGTWTLVPISQRLLREVQETIRQLPANIILRAGDAIHLASARTAGFLGGVDERSAHARGRKAVRTTRPICLALEIL